MNTSQMRYFLCAARHLSFTRAAEELHVSQPAVSKQIAALEQELGIQLFHRDKSRGLSLSAAGETFFQLFDSFFRQVEQAVETAGSADLRAEGVVRLGLVAGWTLSGPVMDAFTAFTDTWPNIDIRIETHNFGQLNELLAEDKLDMIITVDFGSEAIRSPEIQRQKLVDLPRLILFSARHPKASKPNLCPSDFADDKLYLLRGSSTSGVSPSSVCTSLGFLPHYEEVADLDALLLAVDSGHGIAVFDEWVHYRNYSTFRHIPTGTVSPVVLLCKKAAPNAPVSLIMDVMARSFGKAQP